jgi:predicted nucleic acid-binding protein
VTQSEILLDTSALVRGQPNESDEPAQVLDQISPRVAAQLVTADARLAAVVTTSVLVT